MARKTSFFPFTDSGLLAWSSNLSNRINADPGAFGISPLVAANYASLHEIYADAYLAASDLGRRCKVIVAQKNIARANLKQAARQIVATVRGTPSVTIEQKLELGITIPRSPTRIGPPESAPSIIILSVVGHRVRIRLMDAQAPRRGRAPGIEGACVFSHAGEEHPTQISDWTFNGTFSRMEFDLNFPSALAPGTKLWFTAFFYNPRNERGPAAEAISTHLQGGSAPPKGMALAA
jgi:hypothetical protein